MTERGPQPDRDGRDDRAADVPPWLDPDEPHEPARAAAQEAAVLAVADAAGDRGAPRDVLDLGCGRGRLALPLLAAGHRVVGLDRDERALADLRTRAGGLGADAPARLATTAGDLAHEDAWPDGPFDLVLLLGNTILLLVDPLAAASVLQRAAARLAPGGELLIDDVCRDFRPEVTEGRWTSGTSDDGSMQLVWAEDDAVFALRTEGDVDRERWTIAEGEPRYRLWDRGGLTLAAALAGLAGPQEVAGDDDRTLLAFARIEAADRRPRGAAGFWDV